LLVIFLSPAWQVSADSFDSAIQVFELNATVHPFFEQSYAFAIFPAVGKGGIGLGAAYGKGRVYVGRKIAGNVTMAKLTVGFQLGGQAFSEIIFLKDRRAYDEFTSGSYEFDATASAVAITIGAGAQTGTSGASANASAGPATAAQANSGFNKGMAVFTHAIGGLMYEAAIGGQHFKFKQLTSAGDEA
jgi:lipid-binding SYLF domain-containing protein|tara:strand:+ start:200 stop:763 length:564 start_codon:yes stop_codon:yes gene_type:complete